MRREQREMQKQVIRVVYPTDSARIMLRTEENWDSNIEAHSIQQDGCISEFQIGIERPYFYFKPVLLRDGATMWSRGENFLAVATSGAPLEIHPYFREDTHCSVCELMPPLASPSGAEHRFRVFLPPGYYENTLKEYPVLYMHDGHNLFFKEEAFVGNTWRTDEVLNMLIRRLRPVPCSNAQAIDRREVSNANRTVEHGSNGLIPRGCCLFLSRMAVVRSFWQDCLPLEHIHL